MDDRGWLWGTLGKWKTKSNKGPQENVVIYMYIWQGNGYNDFTKKNATTIQ